MLAGICDICGKFSKNLRTCRLCGRRCCEECIDSYGICKICRGGKKGFRDEEVKF